jgi:SNF2 family DNA or RNA helicase
MRQKGRLILGDEMGVGKTIQSLALACIYKK